MKSCLIWLLEFEVVSALVKTWFVSHMRCYLNLKWLIEPAHICCCFDANFCQKMRSFTFIVGQMSEQAALQATALCSELFKSNALVSLARLQIGAAKECKCCEAPQAYSETANL